VSTVRQDLTSNGSEFQVCGDTTEKDRCANSVRVFETISSGASDDRRGRTGTAVWIRSFKYAGVEEDIVLNVSAAILMLFWNVSFSGKSGKVSVSGLKGLVLQGHFQRQNFTEVSNGNKLSVHLISSARCSCSVFEAIDSLNSCIIKHLCCLVLSLLQFADIAVYAIGLTYYLIVEIVVG